MLKISQQVYSEFKLGVKPKKPHAVQIIKMPKSATKQDRKKFSASNLLTPIKHLLKS